MKYAISSGTKKGHLLEREISETLHNIKNSFHSAVNTFTAWESKHDDIAGKLKPGMEETKLNEQIVRIIVLLKRWLLQIEEGYCMGTEGKMNDGITRFSNKALY